MLYKRGENNYYKARNKDLRNASAAERAARFIYLNRFCFNGIYRTNLKGEFNVPYGGNENYIPDANIFHECSRALRHAKLISGDFQKTLNVVGPHDFVYIDPPFSVENQRVFTEYNPSRFGLSNLLLLREWLIALNRKGISFLVSYAESSEAKILREGFKWDLIKVRRSISGYVKSRAVVNEILIYNTY